MKKQKILLLDRDGVINEDNEKYILNEKDLLFIPNSAYAIAKAKKLGFFIIIISNQSAIGRGMLSLQESNRINAKIQKEVKKFGGHIDIFLFCPHTPKKNCDCRKPKTGLLTMIKERLDLNFSNAIFIGDRLSDAETAFKIGATAMLVKSGKPLLEIPSKVPVYENLDEALTRAVYEV